MSLSLTVPTRCSRGSGQVLRPTGCQGCDGAGVPLGFVVVADLKRRPAVVAPWLVAGLTSVRMGVFHEPFPGAAARELPGLHGTHS